MSRYFCYQGNDHDCGFASLKMLLATLNHNKSFLRLKGPIKGKGYTFANLIDIANEYGVSLNAYKCVTKDLSEIKSPSLVLLDSNHLVFLKKITSRYIYISDPSRGNLRIKVNEFLARWSGEILEADSFIPYSLTNRKVFLLHPILIPISFLISTLGVASLVAGLYFIKGDSFVFIPIILLTLFAIIELVEKWYLIKEIKFFDNKFVPLFFENPKTCKSDYKKYVEFKEKYFTFSRKLFTALLLSVLIVVSLILNDPRNCIAVLVLLTSSVLIKLIFRNRDLEKKNNIAKLEETLIHEDNANLVQDIKLISDRSCEFALNISLRKCINTFIVLIISFLLMVFAGEVSVNYVIFHFGLYYILSNNFDVLLEGDSIISGFRKDKAWFIDKCNL